MRLIKKKIITRNDGVEYLVRYSLLTTPIFSIKVHKILISDDACLHDHPWAFLSIILKGGYTEEAYKYAGIHVGRNILKEENSSELLKSFIVSKKYKPGKILYRPADYAHRLVVDKPAWTLVFTFKKVRQWGFFTKLGWVKWFNYKDTNSCE